MIKLFLQWRIGRVKNNIVSLEDRVKQIGNEQVIDLMQANESFQKRCDIEIDKIKLTVLEGKLANL